jgi:PAS domain S-box-containing protein
MTENTFSRMVVLIIDDEEPVRHGCKFYLSDLGFDVRDASNGHEGLDIFREIKPDLVILDLRIPGMNGLEILKTIRSESPLTPVIMLSGTHDINNVVQALRNGASDYLIKPVDNMEILSHCVERALNKAALEKENQDFRRELEQMVERKTEELRKANEELIRNQNELDIITQNVSDVIWTRDLGLMIRYVTPSNEKISGYTQDEIKTKRIEELIYGDHVNRVKDTMNGLIEAARMTGPSVAHESTLDYRIRTRSNRLIWVETRMKVLYDSQGNPSGLVGCTNDITFRKELEAQKNLSLKKAEESDKLKSYFLANMSHEIRTPLNGILGFAELLKEDESDYKTRLRYIETIEKCSDRLQEILENLIRVSMIETCKPELNLQRVDLNWIIDDLYYTFRKKAERKQLEVYFHSDTHGKRHMIETDPVLLRHALSNVLDNAVKFTLNGFISFNTFLNNGHVEFRIKDTGIGIPQSEFENIFKYFRQVDASLTRSFDGAGLGLAITQAYVKILGGKIWLESIPMKGSEFFIKIPSH